MFAFEDGSRTSLNLEVTVPLNDSLKHMYDLYLASSHSDFRCGIHNKLKKGESISKRDEQITTSFFITHQFSFFSLFTTFITLQNIATSMTRLAFTLILLALLAGIALAAPQPIPPLPPSTPAPTDVPGVPDFTKVIMIVLKTKHAKKLVSTRQRQHHSN